MIFQLFFNFLSDCMDKINNIEIGNAKDPHIVMPMHNLIEYSNNHSKLSGSLWQCYRNESNAVVRD